MPTFLRLAIPCLLGSLAVCQPALAESRVDLGYGRLTLNEHFAEGGAEVSVPSNDVYRVAWQQDWARDWGTTLQVERWGTYMVMDGTIAGSTHARTEGRVALSVDRQFVYGPTRHRLGLGYQGRVVQVVNSFAAPAPMYLFSELQVFHGPLLRDRLTWPLAAGFALAADLAAVPYAFSLLGPGIPKLGPMYWLMGDLGIEYGLKEGSIRLSYRAESMRRFNGEFQDQSGPALTVSVRY